MGTRSRRARSSMDGFEKFTGRARKALTLAQDEAHRFGHNYIGTEHILIDLVREENGVAAQVLAVLGVDADKVRRAVEFTIGKGERPVQGDAGLTPRAKKVLELDDQDKVVAARPQDCVCCKLCELRCPDLAIEVQTEQD